MKPAGLLLAAGVGHRFDPSGARLKLLEPAQTGVYAGAPLAVAAARSMRHVMTEVHAVVRPANSPLQQRLHALIAAEGCRLVVCQEADQGMGASLACGVRATADAAGWIIALADMPAVRPSTIAAVLAAIDAGAVSAAPYFGGQRGHPVGFARACFADLAALQADQGARSILHAHPPKHIDVDDPGCLYDVDTLQP